MNHAFKQSELVDLIKKKDDAALNYLYDVYAGALYAEILNKVNNKEVAGILLETVFLTIVRDIKEFDSLKYRLFTWMIQVARATVAASAGNLATPSAVHAPSPIKFSPARRSFT